MNRDKSEPEAVVAVPAVRVVVAPIRHTAAVRVGEPSAAENFTGCLLALVLRSLYFMLKSANLFAKICQSEFSGRYDTFCNTQKRNITILSYCRIFRKLVR